MGERRDVYRVFVGNPEGKRLLGRSRHSLDERIMLRWIFRKWDMEGMDWIVLAQDRDSWQGLVNLSVCTYTCLQTLIT